MRAGRRLLDWRRNAAVVPGRPVGPRRRGAAGRGRGVHVPRGHEGGPHSADPRRRRRRHRRRGRRQVKIAISDEASSGVQEELARSSRASFRAVSAIGTGQGREAPRRDVAAPRQRSSARASRTEDIKSQEQREGIKNGGQPLGAPVLIQRRGSQGRAHGGRWGAGAPAVPSHTCSMVARLVRPRVGWALSERLGMVSRCLRV